MVRDPPFPYYRLRARVRLVEEVQSEGIPFQPPRRRAHPMFAGEEIRTEVSGREGFGALEATAQKCQPGAVVAVATVTA